jgi:hypothetical protein
MFSKDEVSINSISSYDQSLVNHMDIGSMEGVKVELDTFGNEPHAFFVIGWGAYNEGEKLSALKVPDLDTHIYLTSFGKRAGNYNVVYHRERGEEDVNQHPHAYLHKDAGVGEKMDYSSEVLIDGDIFPIRNAEYSEISLNARFVDVVGLCIFDFTKTYGKSIKDTKPVGRILLTPYDYDIENLAEEIKIPKQRRLSSHKGGFAGLLQKFGDWVKKIFGLREYRKTINVLNPKPNEFAIQVNFDLNASHQGDYMLTSILVKEEQEGKKFLTVLNINKIFDTEDNLRRYLNNIVEEYRP